MSRLAKKPILIPAGVTVQKMDGILRVKGAKGEQDVPLLSHVAVDVLEGKATVSMLEKDSQGRANCGTTWSLLSNAIHGVSNGFKKGLQIEGIGYRAMLEGKDLVLHVGFSHPVRFSPPPSITIEVQKNLITISGISKDLVGRTAARIRAVRLPEPYKGKGIRYEGEVIKIKAGKKASTGASA